MKTGCITITRDEAWLLDMAVRAIPDVEIRYAHILLKIGRCVVADREEELELTEEELWLIRTVITPIMKLGEASGADILKKVYRTLLNLNYIPIPASGDIEILEKPEDVSLEVYHENGNNDQDEA